MWRGWFTKCEREQRGYYNYWKVLNVFKRRQFVLSVSYGLLGEDFTRGPYKWNLNNWKLVLGVSIPSSWIGRGLSTIARSGTSKFHYWFEKYVQRWLTNQDDDSFQLASPALATESDSRLAGTKVTMANLVQPTTAEFLANI